MFSRLYMLKPYQVDSSPGIFLFVFVCVSRDMIGSFEALLAFTVYRELCGTMRDHAGPCGKFVMSFACQSGNSDMVDLLLVLEASWV